MRDRSSDVFCESMGTVLSVKHGCGTTNQPIGFIVVEIP